MVGWEKEPDLHAEGGVRVDVGEAEQVGEADEEVSVEGVQRHPPCAPDPHHRLKPNLTNQIREYNKSDLLQHLAVKVASKRSACGGLWWVW